MKANKILAAMLSVTMTAMTFASLPATVYAADGTSASTPVKTTDPSGYTGFEPSETTPAADMVSIRFLDETGEPVDGIEARIERRNYIQFLERYSRYNRYTDVEIIAESADNQIIIDRSLLRRNDVVVVDKLPYGYVYKTFYDGDTYIDQPIDYNFDELSVSCDDHNLNFILEKDIEAYNSYPIEGTFTLDFCLQNPRSGKCIQGLDCVLFDADTGEEYASWTSSDKSIKIENVPYYFGDRQGTDKRLAVRILNMPDNYSFQYDYTPILESNEIFIDPMFKAQYNSSPDYAPYYLCLDSNTVDPPTPEEELTHQFRFTLPPKLTYVVGESLDTDHGLIQELITDANGEIVYYGHVPLYQLTVECEAECDPFTEPGEYKVNVYRRTNGELALTYTVTVVEEPEPAVTTEPEPVIIGNGDVNCDGKLTIADAAAILQYLGNSDKYDLTEQGKRNADCDGNAGLTTADAVFIQKKAMEPPAE